MTAISYNELYGLGSHSPDANLEVWWPCMDNAANTTVVELSGNALDGTFQGNNTSAVTTTGPNSYLTLGFDIAGANYFYRATSDTGYLGNITLLIYANIDVGSAFHHFMGKHAGNGGNANPFDWRTDNSATPFNTFVKGASAGNYKIYNGPAITIGSWKRYVATSDGDTNSAPIFFISTTKTSGTFSSGIGSGGAVAGTNANIRIGRRDDNTVQMNGKISSPAIFSRILADSEVSEDFYGPEPINTVAPVVSGTEAQGQTLTCTTGTWGLGAPFSGGTNGSITYTYQWVQSIDGTFANETDIIGATSSTYTTQPSDVGYYIRCYVRGTNDGGYDELADTASNYTSNAITGKPVIHGGLMWTMF